VADATVNPQAGSLPGSEKAQEILVPSVRAHRRDERIRFLDHWLAETGLAGKNVPVPDE